MNVTKFAKAARLAAPLMIGLWLSAPLAAEASTYISTFQGATFTVATVSSSEFTFDIKGVNALSGDWSSATYLGAFAFANINGTSSSVQATTTIPAGATTNASPGGLNSSGCDGSGSSFMCFNLNNIAISSAVAGELKFDIKAGSGAFDFSSLPHLKIDWTTSSDSDSHVGDLYSQDIPIGTPPRGGVPEPASWTMMIVGLGALGGALRMRRKTAIA